MKKETKSERVKPSISLDHLDVENNEILKGLKLNQKVKIVANANVKSLSVWDKNYSVSLDMDNVVIKVDGQNGSGDDKSKIEKIKNSKNIDELEKSMTDEDTEPTEAENTERS
jgi:hypothetical protein